MTPSALLLRVPSTGDRVGAVDPPISQGLVAAATRRRGYGADVLDLTFTGDAGVDELTTRLAEPTLKVVGMAAYQTNIERCLRLAALVRGIRPDVRVLLGGPQVTHMPADGLRAMPDVDGLCRGPGEGALPAYLDTLDRPPPYAGFLHRDDDGSVVGGGAADVAFDASPIELELWPLHRYPFAVTFSSRGCPHGCAFCYTPASSGRRMQYAPMERVVREVLQLAEAGVPHLFFADPIFVVDRARTFSLLRALRAVRDLGHDLTFSCELRMEQADAELLDELAAAGFVKVAFGLETANAGVLRAIRKPTDLDRFRRAVRTALDAGVAVEVFHLYGLPGETVDDVLHTFDFVASLHPLVDEISEPQQVQLYFGTELLARHRDFGIEVLGDRPPYLSPGKSYRTATLGPDEFAALESAWLARRAPTVDDGVVA